MTSRTTIILETPRLALRRQIPKDLDALWELYCDPEVIRYIPDARKTREQAREELEWHMNGHRRRPELGLWATVLKGAGEFVGRCGLLPWMIEGCEEVEVAYAIGRRYWGRGLGSEAASAILHYGFDAPGLERLMCLTEPGNGASARVAEKIGMGWSSGSKASTATAFRS